MSDMTTTLEAGHELDALIAEKVMGWSNVRRDANGGTAMGHAPWAPEWGNYVDSYSTNMAAAWEVVEKMEKRGWDGMVRVVSDGYVARFESLHGESFASVDPREGTAALAICRAALAAIITDDRGNG